MLNIVDLTISLEKNGRFLEVSLSDKLEYPKVVEICGVLVDICQIKGNKLQRMIITPTEYRDLVNALNSMSDIKNGYHASHFTLNEIDAIRSAFRNLYMLPMIPSPKPKHILDIIGKCEVILKGATK